MLRIGPARLELHPDQPVEGGNGDPGEPHPGQVAPQVLAEPGGRRRVGNATRGEVHAAEFGVGGNEQADFLPARPKRQDDLPVPRLVHLGNKRSPKGAGKLRHDPFQSYNFV